MSPSDARGQGCGLGSFAWVCALTAALSLALSDVVIAAVHGVGAGGGQRGFGLGIMVLFAMDMVPGVVLGLLGGLALRRWILPRELREATRQLRDGLRAVWDGRTSGEAAASLLSRALVAGLLAVVAFALILLLVRRGAADVEVLAVPLALGTAVVLGCAMLLYPALVDGLYRRLSGLSLRRLRVLCWTCVGLFLLGLAVVGWIGRQQILQVLRAADLTPALSAGIFVLVFVALLSMYGTPVAARLARLILRRRWLGAWAALWLVCLAVTLTVASASQPASRFYRAGGLGSVLVHAAAALTDWDDDGYSGFFAEGDCAPFDEEISPAVMDTPGNGIDEDCFDGDARPVKPPVPPRYRLPDGFAKQTLSFLLIELEAVRRDHCSCYGYHRPTTPNIDRLAARATRFERAYAPSSYTYGSLPAIFFSLPVTMIPVGVLSKWSPVKGDRPHLPGAFQKHGYHTRYATDSRVFTKLGLNRLFQSGRGLEDRGERTTSNALSLLEEIKDEPFLLWVDYLAPHNTYDHHRGVREFGDSAMDLYDHEIAFVDREIGRLLRRVDQPDLAQRVVVVIFADHGEAFGEHGTYFHGHNLYDENIAVPLIIRVPGSSPRAIAKPVSLIDIFPTLLTLAGLEHPDGLVGHDLSGAIVEGLEAEDRVLYVGAKFTGFGVKYGFHHAAITGRFKLIEEEKSGGVRLYDLIEDPAETRDVRLLHPDVYIRLRRSIKQFRALGGGSSKKKGKKNSAKSSPRS